MKFDFSPIRKIIKPDKSILLTSHTNPDGDAIGSVLALYHFFTQSGYQVKALVPNQFPDFLHWMPGCNDIIIFEKNKELGKKLLNGSDIIFSLDYNSPDRMGEAGKSLAKSKATKILIDHHINPDINNFDFCYSNINTSSTSELVYLLIKEIGPVQINSSISECIFTGIVTDTGSFSYNCNFEQTFSIVSELIQQGIDITKINRLIYATNTESRLRLLGYSLSEKLKLYPGFNTAIICLSKEELKKYNHQIGDTEGLVNYALSIKGIRFAAFFSEKDEKIRMSFRSVGDFSVNEFARLHFEGGGHRNAAGGDSYLSMEKTIDKFEKLLFDYKDPLTK